MVVKSRVVWRLVEVVSFRVVACWFSACCVVMPPGVSWGILPGCLRGGGHLFVEPLTRALAAYSAREPAHLCVGNRAHVRVRGSACGKDG